jgi:hypothetical protein
MNRGGSARKTGIGSHDHNLTSPSMTLPEFPHLNSSKIIQCSLYQKLFFAAYPDCERGKRIIMITGSDFSVSVQSVSHSEVKDTSDAVFILTPH